MSEQQQALANAKRRLYLKDFSSSQGQISLVQHSLTNLKLNQPKFDSANDSLVDVIPLLKPTQLIAETEILTIRSDLGLAEETQACSSDSFCNEQLSHLMTALKQFIRKKDERISQLEEENTKLRYLLKKSNIRHQFDN